MIQDVIKRAYAAMDPNTGMFPAEWKCKGCRKRLNADGFHPAELYAGTYTGLCYECERAPYFVEKTYSLDGAMVISYPPSSPSWRRNRETFKAYADCETCKGTGVEKEEYSSWSHSSHRNYCRACLERYRSHPLRAYVERRQTQLYHAAEAVWQAELARIAKQSLPKKAGKKAIAAKVKELLETEKPRFAAIRAELLARHKRAMSKLDAIYERICAEETEEKEAA